MHSTICESPARGSEGAADNLLRLPRDVCCAAICLGRYKNKTGDFYTMFYDPNCKHCKKMIPNYARYAQCPPSFPRVCGGITVRA